LETKYAVHIKDETLALYDSEKINELNIPEIYCRKNVCSKVLLGCKCVKCNFYYYAKYQGNNPFDLINLKTSVQIENYHRIKASMESLIVDEWELINSWDPILYCPKIFFRGRDELD
jgi:hypothetical protein